MRGIKVILKDGTVEYISPVVKETFRGKYYCIDNGYYEHDYLSEKIDKIESYVEEREE